MRLTEVQAELVFRVARDYCTRYAPHEMILLELNRGEIGNRVLGREEGSDAYAEALGLGVADDVILPVLLFVLTGIANNIIKDAYAAAREEFVAYLCNLDRQQAFDIFGEDRCASAVIARLRDMLCDDVEYKGEE